MGYPAGEEYWRIKNRDPFWEVIAQGGTMRAACAAVGIAHFAGLTWLRNGLMPEWWRVSDCLCKGWFLRESRHTDECD